MRVWTPILGRDVELRPDTKDEQVWGDTFTGLYHVPPPGTPPPRSVLDAGANIGLVAAHYCHLWPNALVVAVEMDGESLELGRRNAPEALWVHRAVAGGDGFGRYDPAAPTDARRLGEGTREVRCHRLGRLVADHFRGSVDFVKLDVEGAEWEILADAAGWADRVGSVLVELHGPQSDDEVVAAAIAALEAVGYTACRHVLHPRAVYAERP